jgi:hypothetical protein
MKSILSLQSGHSPAHLLVRSLSLFSTPDLCRFTLFGEKCAISLLRSLSSLQKSPFLSSVHAHILK